MTHDVTASGTTQAAPPTIADQIQAVDAAAQMLRDAAAEAAKSKKKGNGSSDSSREIECLEAVAASLKKLHAIIASKGEPTKPGWYWGRRRGINYWRPTCVIERNGALHAIVWGESIPRPLTDFNPTEWQELLPPA